MEAPQVYQSSDLSSISPFLTPNRITSLPFPQLITTDLRNSPFLLLVRSLCTASSISTCSFFQRSRRKSRPPLGSAPNHPFPEVSRWLDVCAPSPLFPLPQRVPVLGPFLSFPCSPVVPFRFKLSTYDTSRLLFTSSSPLPLRGSLSSTFLPR